MNDIFRASDELTNALTERIKAILEAERPTNGDRIREMTDADLARYLSYVCGEAARTRKAYTSFIWETWLKAPALEDKNEQQE